MYRRRQQPFARHWVLVATVYNSRLDSVAYRKHVAWTAYCWWLPPYFESCSCKYSLLQSGFLRRRSKYLELCKDGSAARALGVVLSLQRRSRGTFVHQCCFGLFAVFIIIIIIYPLTARVVWAPQMISQPVSSIFPVLLCPLGLEELQAFPFPDVAVPPLPLSASSSSPFRCALQDGFGQT